MAAAEMRAAWHRTAATCYLLHEDSKRNSKAGQPLPDASEAHNKLEQQQQDQQVSGKDDHSHLFGMAEGWINSHYFMDRKIEFHFQPTDIEAEKLLNVALDSGGCSKSVQSRSSWETVESSTVTRLEGEGASTLVESPDTAKQVTGSRPVQQQLAQQKFESVPAASPAWRNANKGELVALIAKKSSEDMENCDLPPRGLQGKVDVGRWRTDRAVRDTVMLQAPETRTAPSTPMHFSVGPSSTCQKQKSLDFSKQHHKKQRQEHDESDAELPHWTTLVPEGKSELLGEALCRSQTRAREAEKRAAEAVTEKERLLRLFFREASISLTYKHWVKFLEAENTLLRLQAGDEVDNDFVVNSRGLQQQEQQQQQQHKAPLLKECSCKELAKCSGRLKKRKQEWECSSEHSAAVLGCTVGLAFALGVSLAGAGLLFGCTMGWILIER